MSIPTLYNISMCCVWCIHIVMTTTKIKKKKTTTRTHTQTTLNSTLSPSTHCRLQRGLQFTFTFCRFSTNIH